MKVRALRNESDPSVWLTPSLLSAALEMYALAAESLGCTIPVSKLAKVRVVVRGIALLQWMALNGSSYKTDNDAAEEEVMLGEGLMHAAEILFRQKGDALGFTSLGLCIVLHTSRPTAIMVRGLGRGGGGVGVGGIHLLIHVVTLRSISLLSLEASLRPCSASQG
jgi:hypothetical protein